MGVALPSSIHAYVRDFVLRRRRRAILRWTGLAACFALAWVLLACLLDRMIGLPGGVRLGLLLAGITGVVAIMVLPLRRIVWRRIEWISAAADVEREHPAFGERLRTVVSQCMEPHEYQGSTLMLTQLADQVGREVEQHREARGATWRVAARPWAAAGIVGAVLALLLSFPSLEWRVLVHRFVRPMGHTPAVTTTRITVEPGNTSLLRGEALVIRAKVKRLTGSSVDAIVSQDGASWSRMPMLPVAEGDYFFTLPAMDRDLRYFVQGGDATTETYQAIVLRPPAVSEFRIRYEYPSYTQRAPLTVNSPDGAVEALTGTKVTMAFSATEPIKSAELIIAGDRPIKFAPTADARVMQAEFVLQQSGTAHLQLTSRAGLTLKAPQAVSMRADGDREPMARMIQPADDLRLSPRDLLAVAYQAMDDYGIASLSLSAQVNSQGIQQLPIRRVGDTRRLEGQYVLDLASLRVKIGDVVRIGLSAQDGAGKKATTAARTILISPRSIDVNTHQRISELKQAVQLIAAYEQELERVADVLGRASAGPERTEGEYIADRLRGSRAMASAVEAGVLMHQSLLRVCAKSASAEQTLALADCVDQARVAEWSAERLSSLDSAGMREEPLLKRVREMLQGAGRLRQTARALGEGAQAAVILADQANLKAQSANQPADKETAARLKETLKRAEQDIALAVEDLGLRPYQGDLKQQLERRVEAAEKLIRSAAAIDFEKAAGEWAGGVKRHDPEIAPLAERLASASTVEALRPDADAMRARDLQVAAKAAARLSEWPLFEPADGADRLSEAVGEFAALLGALQREHRLNQRAADVRPAGEVEEIRTAANSARQKMAAWARGFDEGPGQADAEELALEAAARTARREYTSAAETDRDFASRVSENATGKKSSMGEVERKMETARQVDETAAEQARIAAQTADAAQDAAALAERQKGVAEKIETARANDKSGMDMSAGSEDARREAAAAIQKAQERLVAMPQEISTAIEAAEAWRAVLMRFEQAKKEAATMPEEKLPAATRMVEMAQMALKDAQERMDKVTAGLAPEAAEELARRLKAYEPETQAAVAAIVEGLQPALQVLQQSVRNGDKGAVDRAAARVRSAIERGQGALRDAQLELIGQDPLVAAKWYAQEASKALAERPPDIKKAQTSQENVTLALNRAWQEAIRAAGTERLAMTPALRSIVRPGAAEGGGGVSTKAMGKVLPGVREWGLLPQRSGDSITAPSREADAPEYQEPLKLYFEALGKAQNPPGRK